MTIAIEVSPYSSSICVDRPQQYSVGWHYDCLEYPLDGPPEGNWNCPLCPPLPEEEEYNCEGEGEADEGEVEASGGEAEDDATALTESEAITQVMSTPRPKKKKKTKSKSRPSRTPSSNRKTWLPQRGPGRPLGSGGGSSAVPSSQRVTFRLRLGSSRSAKGVVDDEKTTPFESFLSPEEFDTSKTIITVEDKNRFEKSRVVAEVCVHAIDNIELCLTCSPRISAGLEYPIEQNSGANYAGFTT